MRNAFEEGQVHFFKKIFIVILPSDNRTIANARFSLSLALAGDGNKKILTNWNMIYCMTYPRMHLNGKDTYRRTVDIN